MKLKNLANFIKNKYEQQKTTRTVFNSRESKFETELLTEREFQALLDSYTSPYLQSAQQLLQPLSQERRACSTTMCDLYPKNED